MSTRTVTVLFTDMVGSTVLSSSLDPEAADRVRQEHFSVLRRALAATEGTEVKNLGDGLMAVFASSSAAIACAVAMQQGVEAENRRSATGALGLRVGVSGGEVTVEDGDYFGDPVVEAARVCALCEGGQIIVTDAVRFLVGRRSAHPFTALGDHELKGLPGGFALFEVGWAPAVALGTGVPLPERLGTDSSAALFGFFGREREKALLLDAVKNAATGNRQVAFLSGEPGIGKTSLCCQVAQRAHSLDVCVLYGRCDEDLGVSYQPFAEALSYLVVHTDDELLGKHVTEHGGALVGLVPALSKRVPDVPALQSADPDTERGRLFGAVIGLLASASGESGLLLVVDDLHWADKATLQLLRHVARSDQLANVMILGTYRDSELSAGNALSDTLASLRREADVQRIDLLGLEDSEIIEMMEAAAGHEMPEDGVALAHAVRQETEGNPFFTTEMLMHLGESGLIRQDNTGRWVATDDLYEQGLPQSVREVVGQRIDRLGDEHRRLLSQAAVIGRVFDVEVLAVVADVDEDHILDVLDQAGAAGLVTEVDGSVDRYSFSHALTQHTLYDDLGASRRARAHRKIAEALELVCGDAPEARSGELARHFVAATKTADTLKALTYTHMAGNHALVQLAPADALGWFTQALDLYPQTASDEGLHCDLLIGCGIAQRQTGDPAHRETLLQAAAIANSLGDRDRLVHAALANNRGGASASGEVDIERVAVLEDALNAVGETDSADRALIVATLASELTFSGDPERRSRLTAEALDIARRVDDPLAFLRVASFVYRDFYMPENLVDRLSDLEEAVTISRTVGDPIAEFGVNFQRAVACLQASDRAGLDLHLDAALDLAERIGQPFERWSVGTLCSVRSLLDGDLPGAEAQASAALGFGAESFPEATAAYGAQLIEILRIQDRRPELAELAEVMGQIAADNPGIAAMTSVLAQMYCILDRRAEALALVEDDVADGFERLPNDPVWLSGMALISEVCVELDQQAGARLLYERLLPWHDQMICATVTTQGPVALRLGLLARALGLYDEASSHFAEAVELSEKLRAPYWTARTQLEWATMLSQRAAPDDHRDARALLQSAGELARRHGLESLVTRCQTLSEGGLEP